MIKRERERDDDDEHYNQTITIPSYNCNTVKIMNLKKITFDHIQKAHFSYVTFLIEFPSMQIAWQIDGPIAAICPSIDAIASELTV